MGICLPDSQIWLSRASGQSLVSSLASEYFEPLSMSMTRSECSLVSLPSGRSYLAIDWHVRAKAMFYDEKASEELEVDDSVNQRTNTGPKQSLQLTECLDLFTTTEKLGEHDPWLELPPPQDSNREEDTWYYYMVSPHSLCLLLLWE
jgi:hypothetical protein